MTVELKKPEPLEIEDIDDRIIVGWANVEVVDAEGDIVPVKELERAMLKFMDRGGTIIAGHQNKPVGKVLRWEIAEHPETKTLGVKIWAKIFDDYEIDNLVWNDIKSGKKLGLSIGATAKPVKAKVKDSGETVNVLSGLELLEISVVDEPANPYALIEAVNYVAKGKDGMCEIEFCRSKDVVRRDEVSREIDGKDEGYLAPAVTEETPKDKDEELNKLDKVLEKIDMMFSRIEKLEEKVKEFIEKDFVEVRKPFAGFKDWDDCMRHMKEEQGYDEETAKKVCGKLKAEYEKMVGKMEDYPIEMLVDLAYAQYGSDVAEQVRLLLESDVSSAEDVIRMYEEGLLSADSLPYILDLLDTYLEYSNITRFVRQAWREIKEHVLGKSREVRKWIKSIEVQIPQDILDLAGDIGIIRELVNTWLEEFFWIDSRLVTSDGRIVLDLYFDWDRLREMVRVEVEEFKSKSGRRKARIRRKDDRQVITIEDIELEKFLKAVNKSKAVAEEVLNILGLKEDEKKEEAVDTTTGGISLPQDKISKIVIYLNKAGKVASKLAGGEVGK